MFKYFSEGGRVAQKRTITQTGVTIRKLSFFSVYAIEIVI